MSVHQLDWKLYVIPVKNAVGQHTNDFVGICNLWSNVKTVAMTKWQQIRWALETGEHPEYCCTGMLMVIRKNYSMHPRLANIRKTSTGS